MTMTKLTALSVVLALGILAVAWASSSSSAAPGANAGAKAANPIPGGHDSKGTLHHVVALKFKDSATIEQVKAVESAFEGLKPKVPGIKSLQWGTNVSPEKLNKGFTHAFVLTFANEADRDAYLVHPAHKDFGKVLGPVLGDVFVIDFWSKE